MNKEFTFAVMAYNQDSLIRLHLNSIKKLIKRYGDGIKCTLIISDDCSSDNTINVARQWVDDNRRLFHEVSILTSENNQGIVGNYCKCLKAITTEWFKILAGDDVYYINNVFSLIQNEYDMIITPTVGFDDNDVRLVNREIFWLLSSNKSLRTRKQLLRKRLKMQSSPCAPSVFFRRTIVTEEMMDYVSQYKWIEDLPSWNYLYSLDNLRVGIIESPMTLYRENFGISLNVGHEKNNEFEYEVQKIKKDICINADSVIKKRMLRYENKFIRFIAGNKELNKYVNSDNPQKLILDYITSLDY